MYSVALNFPNPQKLEIFTEKLNKLVNRGAKQSQRDQTKRQILTPSEKSNENFV